MDTRTPVPANTSPEYQEQAKINRMERGLQIIKGHMPEVYALIKDRAEQYGSGVYALVRRGLAGEPGCFYAMEAGYVVGQPMGVIDKCRDELGNFLAVFGCAYVCIWGEQQAAPVQGAAHGTD